MPAQFRDMYPTTRVIIDCISRHHPHSISNHPLVHHYKHHNTFKGLMGVSTCIIVSCWYTGGISDKEISRCSAILEPGD